MSRPAASPLIACLDAAPGVAAGVVLAELALAAADGKSKPSTPEWIKIGPRGAFVTRDGRNYSFDPEALVARFAAEGVDVPIDLDHGIVEKRPGAVAQGWIREMQARADGLYGRPEWLAGGQAVLTARTHRYVSPSFHHDDQGAATWVHSVSLVPAPALPGAAVASAGGKPDFAPARTETSMKGIAAALGLQADASETACLSALDALRGGMVDKKVHDQAIASLAAATQKIEGIEKAAHTKAVDELLEGALKAKKILPAEKDGYAELCATAEGLASVKKLIEAKPATLGASGLDAKPTPGGRLSAEPNVSPQMLADRANAYMATLAAGGVAISYPEALNHVIAQQEAR